ncbi:ABC transporter substrate-binding protein [Paenibacillus filicis]|uniref:ABC transporter substrate-binding protein n=1 Tax=Paenibacillus gyeongsangnamensis TaxID=3388067 RepID=A0ABT4QC29_9BACL|nr:ABC transporter substrate-binding protein [Paenibacillus filicis]MCZ8514240.1 ABC transporter substrate-binding protein [Paenibacillus filicis]
MKIRWKALSLVLLCSSLLLSACSSGDGNGGETAKDPGGAVTLSVFGGQRADVQDLTTNTFTKTVESKLNIKFKWEVVPTTGQNDKKQLLLASGDYPEVFLDGGLTQAEQLKYGQQGVFIPLNDLIDQYAPNIKKAFTDIPYLKNGITAPDGKIYAIPQINECYHCWYSQKMWINKAWLDKLGLKMPETTEEFYQVLKAFKEKDPNGNGKQDEIPLSGAPAPQTWHGNIDGFLMNAFIYNNSTDYFIMKDGKVDFAANKPEWKKGLEYMNRLYKEGLIDQASFTQNQDGLKQLGNNPNTAILGAFTAGHIGMVVDVSPSQTRHKDYDVVPPLKGPDGVQLSGYFADVGNGVFAITNKASKEKQIAAIKLADYMYTEEAALLSIFGPEGKWWSKAKPGEKDVRGRQAKYITAPEFDSIQQQNEHWSQMGPTLRTRDYRESFAVPQDPLGDGGYEYRLFLATQKYEKYKPKETYPLSIFMDPKDTDAANQLRTTINDYVKASMVEFIIGRKNLTTDWDAYVKGLDGMNLKQYLQIYQKAYDSIYKK